MSHITRNKQDDMEIDKDAEIRRLESLVNLERTLSEDAGLKLMGARQEITRLKERVEELEKDCFAVSDDMSAKCLQSDSNGPDYCRFCGDKEYVTDKRSMTRTVDHLENCPVLIARKYI